MAARDIIQAAAGAAGATEAVYVEDVFSTYLYTGNDSTQTINNGIDLATKGGLVWTKGRGNYNENHALVDTIRGSNKYLSSNNISEQGTGTQLTSFSTFGYLLGGVSGWEGNSGGRNYVSWTFRKQAKFFDVVTYTGTGSARTISHSLGATPGMIIVKRTDTTGNWQVYHNGLTSAANSIQLNLTNAQVSVPTRWNSTAPTSSVFSVGTDATVNASGGTYVAYLFAASNSGGFGASGTDSVVACGSYSGTGADQNITLGWEPQFVLVKPSNQAGWGWYIHDNMRGLSNTTTAYLEANTSGAEVTGGSASVTATATGFRVSGTSIFGSSGYNLIYLAIRRGPMKVPTDATKVFAPYAGSDASAITTGFPVDLVMNGSRTGNGNNYVTGCRLLGKNICKTSSTAAEATFLQDDTWTSNTSVKPTVFSDTSANVFSFRRAPGFFDVVCYTGTGSATTVAHNLGVAPELVIFKKRTGTGLSFWFTYVKSLGSNTGLILNYDSSQPGVGTDNGLLNNTIPTTSVFTVGTHSTTNASGDTYVAYLFATCPGVSKIGSYTGTGTTKQIDCGFASGARFVLIKRTDSTGSWYVWDTARGLVSGNDPYLLLNSTAAEVTNTDYIDPYSAGFEISSTAPAEINANGGSFIFLAIA